MYELFLVSHPQPVSRHPSSLPGSNHLSVHPSSLPVSNYLGQRPSSLPGSSPQPPSRHPSSLPSNNNGVLCVRTWGLRAIQLSSELLDTVRQPAIEFVVSRVSSMSLMSAQLRIIRLCWTAYYWICCFLSLKNVSNVSMQTTMQTDEVKNVPCGTRLICCPVCSYHRDDVLYVWLVL